MMDWLIEPLIFDEEMQKAVRSHANEIPYCAQEDDLILDLIPMVAQKMAFAGQVLQMGYEVFLLVNPQLRHIIFRIPNDEDRVLIKLKCNFR
jgi:hypothetical protein